MVCVSGVADPLPKQTGFVKATNPILSSCKAVLKPIKFEEKPSCGLLIYHTNGLLSAGYY